MAVFMFRVEQRRNAQFAETTRTVSINLLLWNLLSQNCDISSVFKYIQV